MSASPLAHARKLHASISVGDIDLSSQFYRTAFGYERSFRAEDLGDKLARLTRAQNLTGKLEQLERQGDILELIQFRLDDGTPFSGAGPTPLAHMAFSTPDLDAALVHLKAVGAEPLGEIVQFPEGRCVYCREPGGSVFELEEGL